MSVCLTFVVFCAIVWLMRSFILVLFSSMLLVRGGLAQTETEDGVGTLFSFNSATVDSIDVLFSNLTKVMLNDSSTNESIELTKSIKKVTAKTVRVTYTLTYQSGEDFFKATFDTGGQILTVITNNTLDISEYFKYSSKKEYYIQWFTMDDLIVRSKKMNFIVTGSKSNKERVWKPTKKELIANISAINNTIHELENKFSS